MKLIPFFIYRYVLNTEICAQIYDFYFGQNFLIDQ